MSDLKDQIGSLWSEITDTVKLNIDYAKLTGAEKLSTLLAISVMALVGIIIVSIVIFMVSLALVMLLSKETGIFGACMIMAGIYAVLLVALYAMRRRLIIDPIARFVSTLILK